MKTRVAILLSLLSVLSACDKADNRPLSGQNFAIPDTETAVVRPEHEQTQPVSNAGSVKSKPLDTRITPEMVKNLRFDASGDTDPDLYSSKPVNPEPLGTTRVSVTPQVFLKEGEDPKTNYRDYIDGASVQLEVKFD